MKNLFKKLMLVAVAAMAFTACSQDVNEVNKVEKVTRYEFTANIADDTRSGFAEKVEGATAYKSEWHEGDQVKVFVDGYNDPVLADIDTDGNFGFVLENAPESFFMTVCSPAEAWTGKTSWTVPTEQTPLANSVDPKAHILRSNENILVTNDSASVQMSHFASYGKMTVNGVDFKINKVEVSFNGGQVYTINADNVENNTFWFAIIDNLTVSEFTVTAYGDGDSVATKTVDVAAAGKTLKFQWGRVSTFSVSGLEKPAVPEETYDYTSAYVSNSWGDDDKLITFTAEGKDDLNVNFAGRSFDGNAIAAGTYYYGDGVFSYGISLGSYYGSGGLVTAYYVDSVSVSIENNNYVIIFTNLRDQYSNSIADRLTFKGTISGLEIPDPRTTLALPSNVTISVSGKTITLKWNAVVGADGYKVKMWYPHDEAKEEIVYNTQYVFEAQKGNTTYNFNLYSYAKDDNAEYKSSYDWVAKEITTEDTDPKMEVSESKLSFAADGGEQTFNVTLKNFDAEINVTHGDNEWLTIVPNGNTFTVTAAASDVTEKRYDTIVITAGDFTEQIYVEQAAKKAEGDGDEPENAIYYTLKYITTPSSWGDVYVWVEETTYGGSQLLTLCINPLAGKSHSVATYTKDDLDLQYCSFYILKGPQGSFKEHDVEDVKIEVYGMDNSGQVNSAKITIVVDGQTYIIK